MKHYIEKNVEEFGRKLFISYTIVSFLPLITLGITMIYFTLSLDFLKDYLDILYVFLTILSGLVIAGLGGDVLASSKLPKSEENKEKVENIRKNRKTFLLRVFGRKILIGLMALVHAIILIVLVIIVYYFKKDVSVYSDFIKTMLIHLGSITAASIGSNALATKF